MTKRLVEIDDDLLDAARAHFHTSTIKDTVNAALAEATTKRTQEVAAALDTLAGFDFDDRAQGW